MGFLRILFVALILAPLAGCVGEVRATTTARTSTEQLLISTAAERAIAQFGSAEEHLKGKRMIFGPSRVKEGMP